jgi:hypothetical protein
MKYLSLIWADGLPSPEDLRAIQHELPAWVQAVNTRGVRLFGRELDLPETAVTVRARDGQTLVTDGPFAETKEFVAGFDVLECADLDEAIEVAATCPISWFQAIELRPFADGFRLGAEAFAFGRGEDGGRRPYLLTMWMGGTPAAPVDAQTLMDEGEEWRHDMEARGLQVLGHALQGPESATTVRVRGGNTLLTDGPFAETKEYIAGLDVVRCYDRAQAIEVAAMHPISRYFSIEVRPFYVE